MLQNGRKCGASLTMTTPNVHQLAAVLKQTQTTYYTNSSAQCYSLKDTHELCVMKAPTGPCGAKVALGRQSTAQLQCSCGLSVSGPPCVTLTPLCMSSILLILLCV